MSAATIEAPTKKRGGVLSERTPLTVGLAATFLVGSAWVWRSFDAIGQRTDEGLAKIRDEVAEVGDATEANTIQLSALKELVTFQLQTVTDGTASTLADLKARLSSIEERLRLVEAVGATK